jgi:hypothetical protein
MASEAGLGAYLKHGFKVVREVEMDLKPYGLFEGLWIIVALRYFVIRLI